MSKPGPVDPHRKVLALPREPLERRGTSLTRELTRVEEANEAFYTAFRNLDLDAMAKVWSPSPHARCVHPGWELVIGWPDIRQSWRDIFHSLEAIEFTLEDVHVEIAGPTAWVNLVGYAHIDPKDAEPFVATVVTTNIWELVDGAWRLVLHHSSNFSDDDEDEEDDDDPPYGFGHGPPN